MVREFYLITLILSKSELIRAVSEKKKRSRDFHRNSLIIKVVVGDGFEPSKAVLADLQSAPFGRSGIPPKSNWSG